MRTLLLLSLAGLVAGCDLTADDAPGIAETLDGTWTLAVTSDQIFADGTVTPRPDGPTYAVEAAYSLQCNTTVIEAGGDDARVLAIDATPGQIGGLTCRIVTFDRLGRRAIFVGEGTLGTDIPWTLDEASASRHVWSQHAPQAGLASTIRTRWTFTR